MKTLRQCAAVKLKSNCRAQNNLRKRSAGFPRSLRQYVPHVRLAGYLLRLVLDAERVALV